jgi:hypothetical protein
LGCQQKLSLVFVGVLGGKSAFGFWLLAFAWWLVGLWLGLGLVDGLGIGVTLTLKLFSTQLYHSSRKSGSAGRTALDLYLESSACSHPDYRTIGLITKY